MDEMNDRRGTAAGKTVPLLLRLLKTWFVVAWLLWLLFVFQITERELLLGAAASIIAGVLGLITQSCLFDSNRARAGFCKLGDFR